MKGVCILSAAVLLMLADSVRATACVTDTGITVVACGTSTPGAGHGGPGHNVYTYTDVNACAEYTYTGPALQRYKLGSNTPFGITISGININGDDKIHIGNFMCEHGSGGEQCYKHVIESDGVPHNTLQNIANGQGVFTFHGPGSITFRVDDGTCTPNCNGQYPVYNGYELKLSTSSENWQTGKETCEGEGSRLVVINDASVTTALQQLRSANSYTSSLWVGLHFTGSNSWTWVDGTVLHLESNGDDQDDKYTNWSNSLSHDGSPGHECLNIFSGNTWEDENCDYTRRFVCECPLE